MPDTAIGKILLLVGQIDGKVDTLNTNVNKINGSIKDHEYRLTVMETEDEVKEKIDELYLRKHQRIRTSIFAVIGLVFTALNIYSHLVN